jgi:hypothetical protein
MRDARLEAAMTAHRHAPRTRGMDTSGPMLAALAAADAVMFSDDAIEQAAREAFWTDDVGGHIKGHWTWEKLPEDGRENYRKMVRGVIHALKGTPDAQDV